MKKEHREFYDLALKEWGEDSQLRMCIEEMSELTKEICKYMRLLKSGDLDISEKLIDVQKKLKDEIADVLNTAEQLAFIFGEDEIEQIRSYKLRRETERLQKWKKENKGKNYDA